VAVGTIKLLDLGLARFERFKTDTVGDPEAIRWKWRAQRMPYSAVRQLIDAVPGPGYAAVIACHACQSLR
jgi:hypothetical protein